MLANIGLAQPSQTKVLDLLDRTLADLCVLSQKTRGYHWNVRGPRFNDLHKFFESQYAQIEKSIDEVAERIRSLGGFPNASMSGFLAATRLSEPGPRPGRSPQPECASGRSGVRR